MKRWFLRPAFFSCLVAAFIGGATLTGCGPGDTPTGVEGTDEIETSEEYEAGERELE